MRGANSHAAHLTALTPSCPFHGAQPLGGNCQIQAVTVYCAIAMYASYFWLFGKLFLDSQRSKRPCVRRHRSIALAQPIERWYGMRRSVAMLGDV